MNIQAENLNLIKWLAGVNEPSVIRKFIALKQKQQIDWWDEIADEERSDIGAGWKKLIGENSFHTRK
jgi:hypothetical protein